MFLFDSQQSPKPMGRKMIWVLMVAKCGAKDGIRTRDPDLGKVVLYQLSYFRFAFFQMDCKDK
jgi:hypothetical protein